MPGDESVEEDLFTLNAVAPSLLRQLPALFEEAVKDTLAFFLGTKESTGVLSYFRGVPLTDRSEVFGKLDSLYLDRASPLQRGIDRAFQIRVHRLVTQVM